MDSYFCPSCLDEHMPNSEATLNRNKCTNNCLVCPVCSTGLQYEPKEGGTFRSKVLMINPISRKKVSNLVSATRERALQECDYVQPSFVFVSVVCVGGGKRKKTMHHSSY